MALSDAPKPKPRHSATEVSETESEQLQPGSSVQLPDLPRGKWYSFEDGWWFETLACLVSIGSMIAMVVVLHAIDKKPLPNWRFGLSPNTIISVLSTATKSAFLLPIGECLGQLKWIQTRDPTQSLYALQQYDGASRGPLGSLQFIFSALKARHVLAYVAAVVTIVSLAVDPFSQQILQYQTEPVRSSSLNSTMPIARLYDTGNAGIHGVAAVISSSKDPDMQAAIASGLYGNPGKLSFDCPGNECHWGNYTTLGVGGGCQDVTSQVTHVCYDSMNALSSNSTPQTCFYSFPDNGPTYEAKLTSSAHGGVTTTQLNATSGSRDGGPCFPGDASFNCTSTLISAAAIIRFPAQNPDFDSESTIWRDSMVAHRCLLEWTAKSYVGAKVINGTMSYDNVSTYELYSDPSMVEEISSSMVFDFKAPEAPDNGNFSLNYFDLQSVQSVVQNLFSEMLFTIGGGMGLFGTAVFASKDLDQMFANIAQSMTNRVSMGPNSTSLPGDLFEDKTVIHVQWGWISLPIILVIVTCTLFAVTLLLTATQSRGIVWKSSLLPLLSVPRLADTRDLPSTTDWRSSELKTRARRLHAHLEREEDGIAWRLTASDDEKRMIDHE